MYSDAEREIFSYFNGSKEVKADPNVLRRRMFKALDGTELKDLLEQMGLGGKDVIPELAEQAGEKVHSVILATFNMKDLDENGEGATEKEQWQTFWKFLDFLEEIKKKDVSLPTCSEPTEPASSAANDSPTPTTSPSSLTVAA